MLVLSTTHVLWSITFAVVNQTCNVNSTNLNVNYSIVILIMTYQLECIFIITSLPTFYCSSVALILHHLLYYFCY